MVIRTLKRKNNVLYFFFCDCHFFFLKNLATGIFGVCFFSKEKNCLISFIPVSNNITKLSCLSKTHRKYSGCIRIKRPCVSDFLLMYNSAQLCYYIMGSKSCFFFYIKNSAYHKLIPAFLLIHLTDALPYV